ncbi:hypothetical protein SAMN04487968_107109 [Nocardioides terrae]|uniref:Restriction system protein Mrr-like N-terminal domain-containing protein n=1 Tax=Nocardioides terrae TaxID=574651 RepID=A0A1I1JYL9_9ACTN|nr:hypothetical protein [Nocardioides terrae]SFC50853.1 hypothetical protein SAMN04487968_107109 [Nocardioides terrae]
MATTDDYCELCDLPRSQCVHGRPAPAPASAQARTAPAPRKRAASTPTPTRSAGVTRKPVSRRWTPPEALGPIIVDVLTEAGGELPVEELLSRVHATIGEGLRPGDEELTPNGELRWHYAARRARQALISEGVMTAGAPGLWKLA